jgi:hypothetical protein
MARRERLKDKAPNELVDYGIDWSLRLGSDTISSSSWSVSGTDSSLTVDSDDNDTTTTEVRLSSGTLGVTYSVKNTVVTAGGQTFEQTTLLRISVR